MDARNQFNTQIAKNKITGNLELYTKQNLLPSPYPHPKKRTKSILRVPKSKCWFTASGVPWLKSETGCCTWKPNRDLTQRQASLDWLVAVLTSKGTSLPGLSPGKSRRIKLLTCQTDS